MKTRLSRAVQPTPALPIRVLQFGEGNFLRAFADWMFDLLNEKTDFGAGVAVVQPIERGMAPQLQAQDGLYTLIQQGIKQGEVVQETRCITAIQQAIDPYTDFQAYEALALSETLRFVVSNTTEAGIVHVPGDALSDSPPRHFPAKVAAFLFRRFEYFQGNPDKGLVFLPCELIEKNGEKLQAAVLQYAADWRLPLSFTDWVNQHCVFCNTLVDRIVPGYPKGRAEEILAALPYHDDLLVEAEPFHLWVIEAPEKVQSELPFAKAGLQVIFTPDLSPYRTRKVRILNGAHTLMVPVAYLAGTETVRETLEDPLLSQFVREAIEEEIIPTLDMPRESLQQYAAEVVERFLNPFIHHALLSISLNAISKFETRVLPTLQTYAAREGHLPLRVVFALSAHLAFYRGHYQGKAILLNDTPEVLDFFREIWAQHPGEDPGSLQKAVASILGHQAFWKADLNQLPGLATQVTHYLHQIFHKGIQQALQEGF
jgi:tagaturonate reductase